MKEVDYEARCIVRAFADAMEAAVKKEYDIEDFVTKTLDTEAFEGFLTNYTLYSQSGFYIVECIADELSQKKMSLKQRQDIKTNIRIYIVKLPIG